MDPFTMVFLIVLIVFASRLGVMYLRDRRENAEAEFADPQLLEELDALKQRVAVLEEIVTDSKYHLSRELDRLEQEPPAPADGQVGR